MVKIKMDGQEMEVAAGTTILEAAKTIKTEIPSFCYHPKLSIAGNCRMCLVQIKGMNKPSISCKELVREGMEVDTKSDDVKKMQQGVLEFILLNHPLDCPICDQSGECDLQDHYFKFSKFPSRLEDQKIHKPKVKPLGPLVTLDDERCIVCTRCVRFCDEVAKTHELCITQRGGHAELTTYPGKPMINPYSLCTVDICPVGALTSTDFRFKKRVWFLKTTKSVCTGCATGCNVKMDWDDSIVYRYRPRENESVNQCWMCDEGRLTYKFINDTSRVLNPMIKRDGGYVEVEWEDVLEEAVPLFGKGPYVAYLSAQASCEENFALYQFVKLFSSDPIFCKTGKEIKNPSHDDFLIDADKNPNTQFLSLMGVSFKNFLPEGAVVFVLDSLTEAQKKDLIAKKPKAVICFATNKMENDDWANVILPKATFAEQEGTFVNRQKKIQKFWKSFEPRGHSKTLWDIFGLLAKGAKKDWNFANARELFKESSEKIKEFQGLTYDKIGEHGCNL